MFTFLAPILGWGRAVGAFFRNNEWAVWVGAGVSLLLAHKIQVRNARVEGEKTGRRKAEDEWREKIKEANAETADRVERARQAGDEIDEDLFDDSDRTRELNLEQLRKLTTNDPNNDRRRV